MRSDLSVQGIGWSGEGVTPTGCRDRVGWAASCGPRLPAGRTAGNPQPVGVFLPMPALYGPIQVIRNRLIRDSPGGQIARRQGRWAAAQTRTGRRSANPASTTMASSITGRRSTTMGRRSAATERRSAAPRTPAVTVEKAKPEIGIRVIGKSIVIAGRHTPVFGIVVISGRAWIRILSASGDSQHKPGNSNAKAQQYQDCPGRCSIPTHCHLRAPCSTAKALAVEGRHAAATWTWEEEAAAQTSGTSHRQSSVGCPIGPYRALRMPERTCSMLRHGHR